MSSNSVNREDQNQVDNSSSANDLDGIIHQLGIAREADNYLELQRLLHQWPSQVPPGYLDQYRTSDLAAAGELCLELAGKRGDLDVVKSLLQMWGSGAWGSSPTAPPLLPALVAAAINGHAPMVTYLLDHGAEVLCTVPGLTTNAASDVDLVPVFQAYVDHGWDINSRSHKGAPILNYIVDREALVRWFLDNGANPNGFSKTNGLSPLDAAVNTSTTAVVDLLLSHGAKLEDSYPLHQAVAVPGTDAASIVMIDHLLDLNVDINAIQFQNHPELAQKFWHDLGTPLHWAAKGGRKARVVRLLDKGADAQKLSTKGRSALDWARTAKKSRVVEILSSLLASGSSAAQR